MTYLRNQLHLWRNPKTVSNTNSRRKVAGRGAFCVAATKLDEPTATKIREEAKRWRHEVVAKRFGVSLRTVSNIVNGRTWSAT